MAETTRRTMTAAEFLTWDDGTDTRYELVDGVVVAKPLSGDRHGTILGNLAFVLRGGGCRAVLVAGLPLDGRNVFLPDVAATNQVPRPGSFLERPHLVGEVLCAATEALDLGPKLRRYVELPSVREIWLVDSRERWVQVWQRTENAWIVTLPLRGSAEFASEVLGDRVALDELYRNTGL